MNSNASLQLKDANHYAFNLNEFSILIISSLKVASIFNRSSTFEQL